MRKFFVLALTVVVLVSCNVYKSVAKYIEGRPPYEGEVTVFTQKSELPEGAVLLGTVYIGDTGFTTNCKYETVQRAALKEAAKMGGNCFLITAHSIPNFWVSSCRRLRGNVYWVDNLTSN